MSKRHYPAMREPLAVDADYHRHPLGNWTATLTVEGHYETTVRAASLHAVFDAVLDELEHLVHRRGRFAATIHTLDGDTDAFMTLAEQAGLGAFTVG